MRFFLLFLFLAAVCSCALPVRLAGAAEETPWTSADYVQAQLLSSVNRVGNVASFSAGLNVRLAEGWHAYWRMPGEGGLPPRFDWQGSTNLKDASVEWPTPRRFNDFGLQSFGYDKTVLFPLIIRPEMPGAPVTLKLALDIMVCKDICVPQKLDLSLTISGDDGPAPTGRYAALIERAGRAVPHRRDLGTLRIDNIVLGPQALVATVWSMRGFDDADLFVESGDLSLTAKPVIIPDATEPRQAIIRIPAPEDAEPLPNALAGQKITLTFTDGTEAIERDFDF